MVKIGQDIGKDVRCVITNMDEPIGYSVGNQLEIIESVKALKGDIPEDVKKIVYSLGEQILIMSGITNNEDEANKMIEESISSGKAFEKFKELVIKQGGDMSFIDDLSKFKESKYVVPVLAKRSGNIVQIKTKIIGEVAAKIGAGRINKDDKIDLKAGIIINKKVNNQVKKGDIIAYIHTDNKEIIDEAVNSVKNAFTILNIHRIKRRTIFQIIKLMIIPAINASFAIPGAGQFFWQIFFKKYKKSCSN